MWGVHGAYSETWELQKDASLNLPRCSLGQSHSVSSAAPNLNTWEGLWRVRLFKFILYPSSCLIYRVERDGWCKTPASEDLVLSLKITPHAVFAVVLCKSSKVFKYVCTYYCEYFTKNISSFYSSNIWPVLLWPGLHVSAKVLQQSLTVCTKVNASETL